MRPNHSHEPLCSSPSKAVNLGSLIKSLANLTFCFIRAWAKVAFRLELWGAGMVHILLQNIRHPREITEAVQSAVVHARYAGRNLMSYPEGSPHDAHFERAKSRIHPLLEENRMTNGSRTLPNPPQQPLPYVLDCCPRHRRNRVRCTSASGAAASASATPGFIRHYGERGSRTRPEDQRERLVSGALLVISELATLSSGGRGS